MAISRLTGQDAQGHSTTASVTATYPGSTTIGNLLIAVAVGTNNSSLSISTGGTWSTAVSGNISGASFRQAIFYKIADGTEATITASASGSSIMAIDIFEYSGSANPATLDGTATSQNNSNASVTTYTTPLITTLQGGDLILSVMRMASAISGFAWTTSTTTGANTSGSWELFCGEYIPLTAQVGFSDTATWTTAKGASSMIAAFQASNPTPTQQPQELQLLGVG